MSKKKSRYWAYKLMIVIMALVLAGCTGKGGKDGLKEKELDIPPEPPKIYGPLTGREIEDEKILELRPIAVMIDNEINARPQTGLYKADILYEYPVEGGITRYMAVFLEESANIIGPVRSARPYFIDKHFDFNAVYVHCGGSNQAYLDIRDLKVDTINDLKGADVSWRDKSRKAPHNLYTSTEKLRKYMSDRGLENKTVTDYFNFSRDQVYTMTDGTPSIGFTLAYKKAYRVGYTYNANDHLYYRTINDEPMVDRDEKIPMAVTNVIIENIEMKVLDSAGRLEVKTVGSGDGKLFTEGKVMDIKWSKDSRTGKTVYRDMTGREITVNVGRTFIQGMPKTASLTIGE